MSQLTAHFSAMANKIRGILATQTQYTPTQMISAIDDVYDAGYEAGGGGGGGDSYALGRMNLPIDSQNYALNKMFVLNGILYAAIIRGTVAGGWIYKYDESLGWVIASDTTFSIDRYTATIVYHDKVHFLGGTKTNTAVSRIHFSWDPLTDQITNYGQTPYVTAGCKAVVFQDKLCVMGGFATTAISKYFYSWDESTDTWTQEINLPQQFNTTSNYYNGNAVVYNNELHIIGFGYSSDGKLNSSYMRMHYKLDANFTAWTMVETLADYFASSQGWSNESAVVYNNKVYLMTPFCNYHVATDGSQDDLIWVWDGSSWTTIHYPSTNLGARIIQSRSVEAVVFRDKIYFTTEHLYYNGGTTPVPRRGNLIAFNGTTFEF